MINFNVQAKPKEYILGFGPPNNIRIEETIIGLEPSEGFQTSGKKQLVDTRPGGLTRIHLGFVCFFSWLNMAIGMAIGMAEKALNTAVVVINLDSTCCCGQRQESPGKLQTTKVLVWQTNHQL